MPVVSDWLLSSPEYWVVCDNSVDNPQPGDEISFGVSDTGKVQISKNGGPPNIVMHVDHTQKLWAFFNMHGIVQRIRMMSSPPTVSPVQNVDRAIEIPESSASMNSLNRLTELIRNFAIQEWMVQSDALSDMVQVQPGLNGRNTLVVNLPPMHPNLANQQQSSSVVPSPHPHASQTSAHSSNAEHPVASHHVHVDHQTSDHSSGSSTVPVASVSKNPQVQSSSSGSAGEVAMPSTSSQTYIERVSAAVVLGPGAKCTICSENVIDCVLYLCGHMCMCYECAIGKIGCPMCPSVIMDIISSYPSLKNRTNVSPGAGVGPGADCTICYKNAIDCVLYKCGHMCMCYGCAVEQWMGKGNGRCPLCRARINDVIRTRTS